jgi:exopolysaccharide biosynthesis predicted pyruvyltransferase EpsI
MKTVQDYMNDPRILNDPDMVNALEPIKEIHAIRLMSQDERAGMTPEEEIKYLNKKAEDFLAPMGMKLCYDLMGQGKMKPQKN